jgi:hypothetical protein
LLKPRGSTGPKTELGKQRSRRNAVRHGLTAETVVHLLEDVPRLILDNEQMAEIRVYATHTAFQSTDSFILAQMVRDGDD